MIKSLITANITLEVTNHKGVAAKPVDVDSVTKCQSWMTSSYHTAQALKFFEKIYLVSVLCSVWCDVCAWESVPACGNPWVTMTLARAGSSLGVI